MPIGAFQCVDVHLLRVDVANAAVGKLDAYGLSLRIGLYFAPILWQPFGHLSQKDHFARGIEVLKQVEAHIWYRHGRTVTQFDLSVWVVYRQPGAVPHGAGY